MSIIDSFSLEYRFNKKNKKRRSTILSRNNGEKTLDFKSSNIINIYNNNLKGINRNKTTISGKMIPVQLLDNLTSLGYNIDSIMALAKQNKFSTVEEALDLLEKDPETNLYNHYFCPLNFPLNNTKCRICGNSINEHINDDESGNKILHQPNEQFFSVKENHNLEEEKIINNNKFDSNNNSINNQSSFLNGGGFLFSNDNSPVKNKSSFSPDHKSRRINQMMANKDNNNCINANNANNNSYSLLLLKNINDNDKKSEIKKLNISNKNKQKKYTNNIKNKNNINNKIYSNKNNKTEEIIENRTINNISINIKEHLSNYNKGDSVNFNRPIFIRINTINSGRKSKNLQELEYLKNKNENQSLTYTVPIKKIDNKKNEINTIININDYYINENINNNINNNTIESKVALKNIKLPNYCKIIIPKETLEIFNNPNICPICYNNEKNKNNIAQEHCQHKFCDECLNSYISRKIMNGNVLEIKCIMAGCTHQYSQEEIKANVSKEIFTKYKKFYRIQKKLKNPDKKYINCPFIDCEELVDCTNINEGNINCDKGHIFCRKCFKIGGHKDSNCTKEDINISFFKELKKNNSRGVSIRYKQCPECQILIEKIDGCNQMKCLNCGYIFCWLCLREYTSNHFSIYNVNGCPGMRFENERTYKIRNNPFYNCIWHLLSCLLGVGMFILIYLFYIVCGCSYEFVKCYTNRGDDNEYDSDFSLNDYSDERSVNIHNRNSYISIDRSRIGNNLYNTNNIMRVNKKKLRKEKKNNKYIIGLLICLGVICQPFYLAFYFLYALIECYKRLNCLFYIPE